MKYLITLFLFLAGTAGLFAQTENNVVFKFHHKAGTEPMALAETVFPIWNNKKVILNRAEFYISEIELIKADNSVLPLPDVYLLAGADYPGFSYPVGKWDVDQIIGLRLHIGVDSAHNHLDPSTYPLEHPLAHQKNSMHWGWSVGYRFMAVEGKVDLNNDGVPESELQFHNFGNGLYKFTQMEGLVQAQNGVLEINIDLDYAQLFQDMSMTGSLIEHGGSALNNQMMENAAKQGFMKISSVSSTADIRANAEKIEIAPNPVVAGALIRCDLPQSGPLTMLVINSLGQTVRTIDQIPAAGTARFDVAGLPNGVYQSAFYQNGRLIAYKSFLVHR